MKMRTFYKKLPLFIKKLPFFIKNYTDPTYKKLKPQISPFIKNSIFGNNIDPWWSMKYYLCDMWPVLILKLGSLWSRKCKIIWRACLSHNFTYLFSEFWRVQRFCPNDSTQQTVSSFQNDQQKIWQWKGSFFVEKEPASPGRPSRTWENSGDSELWMI